MRDVFRSTDRFSSLDKALLALETQRDDPRIDFSNGAGETWRALFMEKFLRADQSDHGVAHGIELISRENKNSAFTNLVAKSTALLCYKAGKAAWASTQVGDPANDLVWLYSHGADALTRYPQARPALLAHPFLALADLYHDTGAHYDDNYAGHTQGIWDGKNMLEKLAPGINATPAPQDYRDICMAGLSAIARGHAAVSALVDPRTKNPATSARHAGFYYDGISCARD